MIIIQIFYNNIATNTVSKKSTMRMPSKIFSTIAIVANDWSKFQTFLIHWRDITFLKLDIYSFYKLKEMFVFYECCM